MILADEISRTPPQDPGRPPQDDAGTSSHRRRRFATSSKNPFYVLATRRIPIEMEGTYPLPEAQLDRFMFNVVMNYLPEEDEVAVIQQTTERRPVAIEPIFSGEDVVRFNDLARSVPISKNLARYAVRLTAASRPGQPDSPAFVNDWISWGAGTRAEPIPCYRHEGASPAARPHPRRSVQDIRVPGRRSVLRHRILVNYRARAKKAPVSMQ